MAEYKGLPLFQADIDMQDTDTGMFCISLVDFPATQSDFLAFAEDKQPLKYSVQDEDQHIVFGLVMAADSPIFRRNAAGFEYYIVYSAEAISKMVEKYFKEGRQNDVDTMHSFELEDGITLRQMFIKDAAKGIVPKGFEDVNDGSLFAEFRINNEEVWSKVKDGTYRGFSLAGTFIVEEAELKKQENKQEDKNAMKIEKVKSMLRKMLEQFGEIATDKGILVYDGNEDIKVGDAVKKLDEEANEIEAEDGEYRTDDGQIIIVKGGVIDDIQKEEEPKAEEPAAVEEPKAEENAEPEEPAAVEEPVEEPKEDEKDLKIKELEARIAELEAEIAEKDNRIKELEAEPAAPSAEEEFAKEDEKSNPKIEALKSRGYKF